MRCQTMVWSALGVTVLSVLATGPALGDEPEISIGAQVRWRPESERILVPRGGDVERTEARQYLRTRVSAELAADATRVHVMLQDARILGVPSSGNVPSASDVDQRLGVQEAYLEVGELFAPVLGLRAGRYQMKYGNTRLVGAVDWSNTGRTFDAFQFMVRDGSWSVNVWAATLVDRQSGPNDDTRFYGAYALLPKAVDAFALLDYDGRRTAGGDRVLQRWTIGTYTAHDFGGRFDTIINGAYQFGDQGNSSISAYLVTAELGVTGGNRTKVRGAFGLDLASGDKDAADDTIEAFDNLYYTGHKFRGYMDQFLASNPEGLLDLLVRGSVSPDPAWRFAADFHLFRTAASFASEVDGSATKDVGYELDLVARTKQIEYVTLEMVGAAFIPADDWAGASDDPRYWGYFSAMVGLP